MLRSEKSKEMIILSEFGASGDGSRGYKDAFREKLAITTKSSRGRVFLAGDFKGRERQYD